jgi:hypothetical protein
MVEERDDKDLTGDLAIDDESADEVTGGRTARLESRKTAREESREDARKTARWHSRKR